MWKKFFYTWCIAFDRYIEKGIAYHRARIEVVLAGGIWSERL